MSPVGRDVHLAGEGQPVDIGVEAADAVRERLGQHGDGPVGQIDAGAALVGLLVEERAFLHVVRHVGDMHPEAVPGLDLLDGDGVVEVARFFAVDGDRRQVPQVVPALAHGSGHLLGHLPRPLPAWQARTATGISYCSMMSSESMPGLAGPADDPDDPAFRRPVRREDRR